MPLRQSDWHRAFRKETRLRAASCVLTAPVLAAGARRLRKKALQHAYDQAIKRQMVGAGVKAPCLLARVLPFPRSSNLACVPPLLCGPAAATVQGCREEASCVHSCLQPVTAALCFTLRNGATPQKAHCVASVLRTAHAASPPTARPAALRACRRRRRPQSGWAAAGWRRLRRSLCGGQRTLVRHHRPGRGLPGCLAGLR